MKGIRLFIQPHGYIENDLAWNIANPEVATVSRREITSQWISFPTFSVLIEHSEVGWILYDTGPHPGVLRGRLPEEAGKFFLYVADEKDFLEERLKLLALKPQDIAMVIISHLHWDHVGNLYLFSGTQAGKRVIVGEEDLKMAFFSVYLTPQRFFNGYFKEDIDVPGIVYSPVRGDCEIAPGVEVISLGGHTPQVLGLVVYLEHFGTVILTSDALPMRENLGPPPRLPGIVHDSRAFYDTVEKIEKLRRKLQATVIHPHDPKQFSTLRYSPEPYD